MFTNKSGFSKIHSKDKVQLKVHSNLQYETINQ